MSYSASFMACQIPLKLGLPSGVRGARYAVGGVARVAGAVWANDGEAMKHNAHTVSVIAILKALFPADTPIRRPSPLSPGLVSVRGVHSPFPARSGKIKD